MLLREVEYARPGSIEEAVRLLGAHDGARALAGGQTLVNVMKARAAAPEVLVDLADLDELRDDRALGRRRRSSSARWSPTASSSARPRSPPHGRSWPRSRPRSPTARSRTAARWAATSASTTRPTTSRRCSRRVGATFTILGADGERTVTSDDFFLGVYMTAAGEGELLTRISVPAATPGTGDAMEGVTLGVHGTYIVSAAATVGPGGVRVAIGCVSGVPERATTLEGRLAGAELTAEAVHAAVAGIGDDARSARRRPRARRVSPAPRRDLLRARRAVRRETSKGMSVARAERQPCDLGRGQRHDVRARGRRQAPARALHPRRSRPHGHAHRLRHRQLRRLHHPARRPGRQELHDAGRPGRRRDASARSRTSPTTAS